MGILFIGEGALNSLLITLIALVFELISKVFGLFVVLAKVDTLDSSFYAQLVRNFYIILTVVMLFAIAFGLLKSMVNPDDSKGTGEAGNIFKKLVTSIVILALLPTIFNFAFGLQNAIISQNTIGKLFGNNYASTTTEGSIKEQGNRMANAVFTAFFVPTENVCDDGEKISVCQEKVTAKTDVFGTTTLAETISRVNGTGNFASYADFGDNVADGEISFNFLVLLFAGLFFAYVVLSFCFDLGVRAVKLVFYQIIAPIPVLLRITPQEKLSGTFNTWVKIVVSCYLEVFIRLFVLYFGVYLASAFTTGNAFGNTFDDATGATWLLAKAILILSIVVFIKESPKLIGELFGIDSSGMKLGLRDKLAAGGLFAAGGAVGSLIASRGNPLAMFRGWKNGLTNVGAEAQAIKAKKDALAAGATRRQLLADSLRKTFGFNSMAEAEEKNVREGKTAVKNNSPSSIKYTDSEGNVHEIKTGDEAQIDDLTAEQLNSKKTINIGTMSAANDQIRDIDNKIKWANDQKGLKSAIEDEAKKKFQEGKFEYKIRFRDLAGNVSTEKVNGQRLSELAQQGVRFLDDNDNEMTVKNVTDKMIDAFSIQELSSGTSNLVKNKVYSFYKTLDKEGGFSCQAFVYDDKGQRVMGDDGNWKIKESSYSAVIDDAGNRKVIETTVENGVEKKIEYRSIGEGMVSCVEFDAKGNEHEINRISEFDLADKFDKASKDTSGVLEYKKQGISLSDEYIKARDENDAIDAILKQRDEKVNEALQSQRQRDLEASKKYTARNNK